MKNTRKNKKGFTLVELIIVLVILAILAAILVPALLGWIDRADNAQDIIDARALMNAVQAQMTEEYGIRCKQFSGFNDDRTLKENDDIFMKGNEDWGDFWVNSLKLSGVEEPFVFVFYTQRISGDDIKEKGISALHDAYTVMSAVYWSDPQKKPVFYDFINNSWEEGSPYSADLIKRGVNEIQSGDLKGVPVRVCIAGGYSKNASYDAKNKTKKIQNINNMILKVMEYKGKLNTTNYNQNVKIE